MLRNQELSQFLHCILLFSNERGLPGWFHLLSIAFHHKNLYFCNGPQFSGEVAPIITVICKLCLASCKYFSPVINSVAQILFLKKRIFPISKLYCSHLTHIFTYIVFTVTKICYLCAEFQIKACTEMGMCVCMF